MGWKLTTITVPVYEADPKPPGVVTPPIYYPPVISGPPGPWPTPPIAMPGPPVDPGYGIPGPPYPVHPIAPGGEPPQATHPIAPGGPPPGIWGPPGPWPTPPIYLPPSGGGGEGIWGPTDPRPTPPIAMPPAGGPPGIWPPPGVVSPPIYYPPGIWPPPGVVSPPIYYPGPPVDPGYGIPLPPGGNTGGTPPVGGYPGYPAPDPSPIFDPDDMPEHPELPDLNSGYWMSAYQPTDRVIIRVFVAGPVSDHPEEPVNRTPGDWVVVRDYGGMPAWAWRPEPAEVEEPPHVDHELPGDQPVVTPHR